MRSARDERGAISLITALSLAFIFASAALGVDVGATAFEHRDIQKVADLAALDSVRAVGDLRPGPGEAETASARALRFARESAARNDFLYDDAEHAHAIAVALGIGDPNTREFEALPAGADELLANAVLVTINARYEYRFAPGGADLETTAVAINDALAAITVGSRLASLNTADAPLLNETLEGLGLGPVTIEALGYEGLATADVTLGELWAALELGSTDQILRTEVTLAELVDAMIEVLDDEGDTATVEAKAALVELKRTANIPVDRTFTFDDLIEGSASFSTSGRAAGATIKVLDLLLAAAEVANGENLVAIDVPVAQVPGVASGTIKVGLIEKPAFAVGPALQDASGAWVTTARTAQARVAITLRLERQLVVGATTTPIDLPIYIDAASATAELTAIDCAAYAVEPENVRVNVHAFTSALNAHIASVAEQALTNPNVPPAVSDAVFSVVSPTIRVTGDATTSLPGDDANLTFIGPFDARVARVGSTTAGLGGLLASDLNVAVEGDPFGVTTALIVAQVRAAVSEVLALLDETLFEPLVSALGVRMAGADVTNPWLDCAGRRLIQ